MSLKSKDILFITHDYKSFIKDQIEETSKYFNSVTVIVRYKPIGELARIIPINALKTHKKSNAINLKALPANIKVYALPLYYLPTDNGYKKLGKTHFKKARKLIEKESIQFDLIHGHFLWTAGFCAVELGKHFKKPVIVTGHGYDVYQLPFQDEYWKNKIAELIIGADAVTTVSNKNKKHLNILVPKKEVKVITNGYSPQLFYKKDIVLSRKELGLENKKILLSVGNIYHIKGHDILIRAIAYLSDKTKEKIKCYIVGEGGRRIAMEKLINDLNLDSIIELVGAKPHHEINDWMNAAEIFVLPSRNEGNPTVMFECMATGTPFIGSKVGGIPEIINNDNIGILFEPEDVNALSLAIDQAVTRTWDSDFIKNQSDQYTWGNIVNQNIEEYKQLL